MSRTLSGNLTGMAAVTAAREFREDLQIEAARERARRANPCFQVCQDIRDMMTQEQYDAWHEAAPEVGFYEHAQAKLAELQTEHAVIDVPEAVDEAAEIQAAVQMFGGEHTILEPFSHEDWMSENEIANEMRGGL